MLKVPTDAPRELVHLFHYQLTVFNSIRLDNEEMEMELAQLRLLSLSKKVKSSVHFQWYGGSIG